ncbi:hypothetical protein DERF_001769 [Dermatophagoides farinae]|uniref:Reverse transcriptase Ty1/copia-type domain-containing protein n=1 Tax=Dermatophagoides farinae TaxID=6954 RepID=A0A922LD36_DERFA|nr:hypothetical protein DERF_001769 [Dermatophagoides farinae]
MLLLIYVDDIFIIGPDTDCIDRVIRDLEQKFEMTDIGKLNDYLGVQIIEKDDHFELNQIKYIRKIMNEFRMNECKPTNVPMASLYIHNEDEEIDENLPIRELIGSLLYVANKTRPDILFSTNWLSRFLTKPTKSLFNAAKQILRYLSGTIDKCLIIGCLEENLLVYTDSSFGQGESKHSTSGLVIRCGNSTIEWKSNKQRKISVSSCESEITAIMDGYKCVTFIKQIFQFLKFNVNIIFKCDNQSVIHLITNQKSMKRSRYFDIEIKKLIEVFQSKDNFRIEYVNTKQQYADFLTKPISKKILEETNNSFFVN